MIHHDRSQNLAALRGAVPYLRLYKGRTFVVKIGGAALTGEDCAADFLEQVGVLHQLGIHVLLVHGGGPQTDEWSQKLGVPTQRVQGRRVTCERTLDVSTMVLCGLLGTRIVARMRGLGLSAVGIRGVDGGSIVAERRPPRTIGGERVDFGHVGDVASVDPSLVRHLFAHGEIPVLSPICATADGQILNLNADGVAARMAVALGATKLILATGVAGVLEDPEKEDSLISITDLRGLDELEAAGRLRDGMLPKVTAIRDALQSGVPRVHVISHAKRDALLTEVFTNEGSGTLVVSKQSSEDEVGIAVGEAG